MTKKLISLITALLVLLAVIPFANAEDVTELDVSTQHYEITEGGYYHVTGTSTYGGLEFKNNITAYVTLEDVTIDFREETSPAIYIEPGSTVYLTLKGVNYLYGGDNGATSQYQRFGHAGISVESIVAYDSESDSDVLSARASLYINGDGTLYSYGLSGTRNGNVGGPAGIGGNANGLCGYIEINSGTVYAYGGVPNSEVGGAGIGTGGFGGQWYTQPNLFGEIVINGGTIIAQGGNEAAGIGGGANCDGGKVTITGGNINALGGQEESASAPWSGAGIGGGDNAGGAVIAITGGDVTAVGGRSSAGIGTGRGGEGAAEETKIIIGGDATVEAIGGSGTSNGASPAAGIGTGACSGSIRPVSIIIGEEAQVTAVAGSDTSDPIGSGKKAETEHEQMVIIVGESNVPPEIKQELPEAARVIETVLRYIKSDITENLVIKANEIYIVPTGYEIFIHPGANIMILEGGELIVEGSLEEYEGSGTGIIDYGGIISGSNSEEQEEIITDGTMHIVLLPQGKGYTTLIEGKSDYIASSTTPGSLTFRFRVVLSDDYTLSEPTVKVNGVKLVKGADGYYSVENVNTTLIVTVDDVKTDFEIKLDRFFDKVREFIDALFAFISIARG